MVGLGLPLLSMVTPYLTNRPPAISLVPVIHVLVNGCRGSHGGKEQEPPFPFMSQYPGSQARVHHHTEPGSLSVVFLVYPCPHI